MRCIRRGGVLGRARAIRVTATCETDDGLVLRLRKEEAEALASARRATAQCGKKTTTEKTISRDDRRAMVL